MRPARWRPSCGRPDGVEASSARCPGVQAGELERTAADRGRRAGRGGRAARRARRRAESPAGCCRSPAPSTPRWSPGREPFAAWPGTPARRLARPAGVLQYRRRALTPATCRDRRAAGRPPRQPCPLRRHDRGDVPRRARVFIEVGPGSVLTPLVGSALGDRPHLAVAGQPPGPGGLTGWLNTIARLAVAGIPLRLEQLARDRVARTLDLQDLPSRKSKPTTASTWLVDGGRARPINEPEISRLGQGEVLESTAPALRSAEAARLPHPEARSARRTEASQSPRRRAATAAQHENGDGVKFPLSPPSRNGNRESSTPMNPQRVTHRMATESSSRFSRRCRRSWKSSDRRCSRTSRGEAPPHLLLRPPSNRNSSKSYFFCIVLRSFVVYSIARTRVIAGPEPSRDLLDTGAGAVSKKI